jgi:hypothetical protein
MCCVIYTRKGLNFCHMSLWKLFRSVTSSSSHLSNCVIHWNKVNLKHPCSKPYLLQVSLQKIPITCALSSCQMLAITDNECLHCIKSVFFPPTCFVLLFLVPDYNIVIQFTYLIEAYQ